MLSNNETAKLGLLNQRTSLLRTGYSTRKLRNISTISNSELFPINNGETGVKYCIGKPFLNTDLYKLSLGKHGQSIGSQETDHCRRRGSGALLPSPQTYSSPQSRNSFSPCVIRIIFPLVAIAVFDFLPLRSWFEPRTRIGQIVTHVLATSTISTSSDPTK